MDSIGKTLVIAGLGLALVGAILWAVGRHGGTILPGDIVIERRNFRFYFPLATCLVISLILSVIMWFFRR